jgi:hypothetical protein
VDPLDRELASLLSIEPSPEFRARIRVRIAREPALSAWFPRWRVVIAGAVVLSMAIAMAVGRGALTSRARRDVAPPASASAAPAVPGSDDRRTVSRRYAGAAPGASGRATAPGPLQQKAAEVLVADSEVRGLRQLAAIVAEGRVHFVFANEPVLDASMEPVRDIVVAPIAIAPIEAATNAESGGQSEGDQ